jgi:hypothetical protein
MSGQIIGGINYVKLPNKLPFMMDFYAGLGILGAVCLIVRFFREAKHG